MRKRKKRLKKIPVLLVLLISSFLIFNFIIAVNNNLSNGKKTTIKIPKEQEVDYNKKVFYKLKDQNISLDFIEWVSKNYKGSISYLDKLLTTNSYDKSLWHVVTGNSYIVLNDLYNNKYKDMSNVKVMESDGDSTISIVGDISLADNWYIMPEYDKNGITGILSEEILNIMKGSTLMVGNSEFTVSNRGSAMRGKQYTFRAKPERLAIYDEMGMDLVTLANNHVYDFGKEAFLDMLDHFDERKMPRIGAGRNLEEASSPYYFIINGYKFAFLSATRAEKYVMTPGATDSSEGVFRCYDRTNLINKIKEIRDDTDFIITIVHFGTEQSHTLEKEQMDSARAYIDAGSDIIVGHHAHVLQGVEIYNGKPIIYNLGNFIFNPAVVDTAIFQIKVKDDASMEYYMIPALQKNCKTTLLKGSEKQRIINDINKWSINAHLDENGKIS